MTPSPAVLTRSLTANNFKDNIQFAASSVTAVVRYNGVSPTFESPVALTIYFNNAVVGALAFDASRVGTPFAYADPFNEMGGR